MAELGGDEGRVLGALVEKALTTPQQYPLSRNALVSACNQSSNRDPVVAYDEGTVADALDVLKERRLVRFVLPSHGRSVVRFRHVVDEVLGLDERQQALLAVLLLRGPQTVGELRGRTERMADFGGPAAVEHDLQILQDRDEPLVARLTRRPGQKEERWCQLLAAAPEGGAVVSSPEGPPARGVVDGDRPEAAVAPSGAATSGDLVATLRREVAALRDEVDGLRAAVEELRTSLGG